MKTRKKAEGRVKEKEILEEVFSSKKAEFLALYGRRRVGKTFLIRHFFQKKPCIFFNATGVHNAPHRRQIGEFTREMEHVFFPGAALEEKGDWFAVFELLTAAMQRVPKKKKIILFFDEFPWMVTPRSKLLQALDHYWNRHWSQDPRLKLIVCGSAASWIIRNIVKDKGGLHNRLTRTIRLDPMNLAETKDMLRGMGVRLNETHLSQIYMVTGGIPFYLSHVPSGLSSSQVIEHLAFSKNNLLLEEFDRLYSSLFDNHETYVEIVRTIALTRAGISQEELFDKLTAKKGGSLTRKLEELEEAGFILSFTPYKHKKKGIFYRVVDEYTLFYFHWIEPIKDSLLKKGLKEGYWEKIMKSPSWACWAGYAFGAICFKHLNEISDALDLSPGAVPGSWRYAPRKGSKESGAQIDLLFDREDDAITICELKYTGSPFAIDKEYAANLRKKMEIFRAKTRSRKQLFLGIVSANGLKETLYSSEMVDGLATLQDLYKSL